MAAVAVGQAGHLHADVERHVPDLEDVDPVELRLEQPDPLDHGVHVLQVALVLLRLALDPEEHDQRPAQPAEQQGQGEAVHVPEGGRAARGAARASWAEAYGLVAAACCCRAIAHTRASIENPSPASITTTVATRDQEALRPPGAPPGRRRSRRASASPVGRAWTNSGESAGPVRASRGHLFASQDQVSQQHDRHAEPERLGQRAADLAGPDVHAALDVLEGREL